MNQLHDAMLKCLSGAQKQLDEVPVSGLSLVLIGPDNVVRYGSVAEDHVELARQMLLCAWAMLREINSDIKPDGFSQAAFAIATRAATPPAVAAFDAPSADPQRGAGKAAFASEGHRADSVK